MSCNPLGKNPGDLWVIPNVKSNHVEKTSHPCQFPIELVERLVLSLTPPDAWVFDPFLGAGTSVIAALRHGRRGMGAEMAPQYARLAEDRIEQAIAGTLEVRPMHKPVFNPDDAGTALRTAPWLNGAADEQFRLLEPHRETAEPNNPSKPVKYQKAKRKTAHK